MAPLKDPRERQTKRPKQRETNWDIPRERLRQKTVIDTD